MDTLPDKNYGIKLFFDGKLKETEIISLYGIHLLTKRYAGRGSVLHPKFLIQTNKDHFSAYLDILYWCATRKSNICEAFFFAKHLERTGLYEIKGFTSLYSHVGKHIQILQNKIYKVYISCLWTDTKTLYHNWKHLFDSIKYVGVGYKNFILTENLQEADYFVIIWGTRHNFTDEQLKRTIFLRTEPILPDKMILGARGEIKTEPLDFLRFYDYYDQKFPNCAENWLQRKPAESIQFIGKQYKDPEYNNTISAIVSAKYFDPGHIYRIDLLKYIIQHTNFIKLDIYGFDNTHNFPEHIYKGKIGRAHV